MNRYLRDTLTRTLAYAKANLADIPDDKMCVQPAGSMNHPAWTVGHIVGSFELGLGLLGGEAKPREGWRELFARGSTPSTDGSRYPSKDDLVRALEDAHARMEKKLADIEPSAFEEPMPDEGLKAVFPKVGDFVFAVVTVHEGMHIGQLTAWRRAMGLAPPAV
jgi:hypothetical protein